MRIINSKYIKIKLNSNQIILIVILLVGLFLRLYKLEIFYTFNHDQDLYSWIVKDILVDHHFRMIGQLTSIDGVFIGPLFYYLLVPFFKIFNLDPLSATVPITIIGVITIYSIYWTLSNLFERKVGLFAAFLYSVSWANVFFDRWVVPTQPTVLWSVWYFFALAQLLKGNARIWPLLLVLLGLIWHIHLTLLPLSILIPISFILGKNSIKNLSLRKSLKQFFFKNKQYFYFILMSVIVFFLLIAPLCIFEIRYGFQQINGLIDSLTQERGEPQGLFRAAKVLNNAYGSITGNLLLNYKMSSILALLLWILISVYLTVIKILPRRILCITWIWLAIILLSQIFSKRNVSEYYFANLNILFIIFISLLINFIYQNFKLRLGVLIILLSYLIINIVFIIRLPNAYDGYIKKKELVEYIAKDARLSNYSCISLNYIAYLGTNVGFRYLFWYEGIKIIKAGSGAPIYNIVIPASLSGNEINKYFGSLGVILPNNRGSFDSKICDDPNNQLIPLLGFTK